MEVDDVAEIPSDLAEVWIHRLNSEESLSSTFREIDISERCSTLVKLLNTEDPSSGRPYGEWIQTLLLDSDSLFGFSNMVELLNYCPNIKKLIIQSNQINDTLQEIMTHPNVRKLSALQLRYCDELTFKGISAISRMTNLEELYLGGIQISDQMILKLLKSLRTTLKILDIQFVGLHESTIQAIARDMPSLQELNVRDYTHIGQKTLNSLISLQRNHGTRIHWPKPLPSKLQSILDAFKLEQQNLRCTGKNHRNDPMEFY